eukprot:6492804-Amphidinium_carterae.1
MGRAQKGKGDKGKQSKSGGQSEGKGRGAGLHPSGGNPPLSASSAVPAPSGAALASGAQIATPHEESRHSPWDKPPQWTGAAPDSEFDAYMKAARAWLSVTRTPLRQRAIALLSGLSGHPRVLAAELEAEELVQEDGADLLLGKLTAGYSYITARKLPHKFHETIFHPSSKRQAREGLATYVSRKKLLFRQLHASGCTLPDVAQGLLMLKDAQISAAQHETLLTWLQGAYSVDEVAQALMKLEQPRFLPGTTHTAVTPTAHVFVQDDGSEWWSEYADPNASAWDESGVNDVLPETYDEVMSDNDEDLNQLLEATDEFSEEQAQLIYLTSTGNRPSKGGGKSKTNYRDFRAQIQAARLSRGFAPPSSQSAATSQQSGKSTGPQREPLDKQTWRQQRLQRIIAKSRCAKCGQIGHWARTCVNPPKQNVSPSSNFFVHVAAEQATSAVQHHWIVHQQEQMASNELHSELAVLDSGAQTAVCGNKRWHELVVSFAKRGLKPMRLSKVATTTHGIGGVATTSGIWRLPIGLGGSPGLVDVTIIEHEMVPLLLPISLQRDLGMVLSLPDKVAVWTTLTGAKSKLVDLPSGHIAVSVTDWSDMGWQIPADLPSHLAQVIDINTCVADQAIYVGTEGWPHLGVNHTSTQEDPSSLQQSRSSAPEPQGYCRMGSVGRQCSETASGLPQSQDYQHMASQGLTTEHGHADLTIPSATSTVIDGSSPGESATSCATYCGSRSDGSKTQAVYSQGDSSCRGSPLRTSPRVPETAVEQEHEVVHVCAVRGKVATLDNGASSCSASGRENANRQVSGVDFPECSNSVQGVGGCGIRVSSACKRDAHLTPSSLRVAPVSTASNCASELDPAVALACTTPITGIRSECVDSAGASERSGYQGASTTTSFNGHVATPGRRNVHFIDEFVGDAGTARSSSALKRGVSTVDVDNGSAGRKVNKEVSREGLLKTEAIAALQEQARLFVQTVKPRRIRTAVGDLVDTFSFGLYTKQGGAGITALTFEHENLVRAVHLAAESLGLSYTSFAVNLMLVGSCVDWHRDVSNFANAVNAIIQFSATDDEYEGGEVQLLDDRAQVTCLPTVRCQWLVFNPHSWHRITKVQKGARISIVLYTAGSLHRVDEVLWMKLRSLRFPVTSLRSEAYTLRKQGIGPLGSQWVHKLEHAVLDGCIGLVVNMKLADSVSAVLACVNTGYDKEGIHLPATSQVFFELLDWSDHTEVEDALELKVVPKQLRKQVVAQSGNSESNSVWKTYDAPCWPTWSAEEREVGLDPAEDLYGDVDDFDADAVQAEGADAWIPSDEQQADVKRLHDNLGHPSVSELLKMLHRGRAFKPIIKWVKHHFRCPTCEASVRPGLRTVAKHPSSYSFNQMVGIDLFFLRSPINGSEVIVLNCLCWGTSYQSLQILPDRAPETVWWGFSQCWARFAGLPKILVSDGGGEFQGYFSTSLGQAGVAHYQTDARSPWQNGRTERAGAECKRLIYKTVQEVVPCSDMEFEALVYMVAGVRNRHNMTGGFSPNQRVFGSERGIPDSLICPSQRSALVYEGPLEQMRNADAVRQCATRAWATSDNRDRLLRASRAKHRKPMAQLTIGQYVYLWRQPNLGRGAWIGPGQVVTLHPTGAYISLRGSLYKAARINLRPATPEEQEADTMIRNFASSLRQSDKVGLRKFHDVTADTSPVIAGEHETLEELDTAEIATMEENILQGLPSVEGSNLLPSMPEVPVERPPVLPVTEVSSTLVDSSDDITMAQRDPPTQEGTQTSENREEQPSSSSAQRHWTEMTDPTDPPWRRQRREQDIQEMTPLFRGSSTLMASPRTPPPPQSFVGAVQTPEKPSRINQHVGPVHHQLEKGIVKPESLPPNVARLFLEGSRLTEAETVQVSMKPVVDETVVQSILTSAPERVIFSRWLDTLKSVDETSDQQAEDCRKAGIPVGLVPKSRLILQGFTDPDHEVMDCEVPAAEVGDITMTCQLLATHQCEAYIADIKGAFNQAQSGLRAEPLYVLLPESYPMWPGVKLAQLVKELYGLLPGPASWRYTLLQEAKRLGFIKHGVCPCLLCFPEPMVVDVDGRYIKSCRQEDNSS